MNLEICVDSVESAIAAAGGGAERVELCSALSEGGITPSTGLISAVRSAIKIDVFVIIRPRGGDFVYSDPEFDVMRKDILEAKARHVNGVVLGILTAGGTVDVERVRNLVEMARPLQVTFHRAFDRAIDMDRALEDVIACGVDRILTSGGEPDAMRGASRLAQLQKKAGDRIRIMAGGGIRASNVRTIALLAGVREVHTSLRKDIKTTSCDGSAQFGNPLDRHRSFRVLEHDVRAFKALLDAIDLEAKPGAGLR